MGQDCPASPALFNLYTEQKVRESADQCRGSNSIRYAYRVINNLSYADDTVLLAESEEDLQKLTDAVYDPGLVLIMTII